MSKFGHFLCHRLVTDHMTKVTDIFDFGWPLDHPLLNPYFEPWNRYLKDLTDQSVKWLQKLVSKTKRPIQCEIGHMTWWWIGDVMSSISRHWPSFKSFWWVQSKTALYRGQPRLFVCVVIQRSYWYSRILANNDLQEHFKNKKHEKLKRPDDFSCLDIW